MAVWRTSGWILLAGLVAAPAGWLASDRLERDNRFCVACHLPDGSVLHDRKRADFAASPATSLVAAHARAEPEFLCIQCHGGASAWNKLRVKTVAARDALRWLIRSFEEPQQMRHPLWDEDCVQCHAAWDPGRTDDFHAIGDHNVVDFAYRCVECHRAHPTDGTDPALGFLIREQVTPICLACHEEL